MGRTKESVPQNIDTSILANPLSFTRTGYYYYGGSGTLNFLSSIGRYWSPTPNGKADAYNLYFDFTRLYPSGNYDRGFGLTLRCLAR